MNEPKLRVFHGADFHLDTPFSADGCETPSRRREQLRQAAVRALQQAEDCDLVLLAGDVFDHGGTVYPETIELLQNTLAQLRCPVFISPGNHDPWGPAGPWADRAWPKNVHIFQTARIQAVDLPELGCTVYGAAFLNTESGCLLQDFRVCDRERLNLMVLHADALHADSPYNAITREQIAATGLDYLALGHIHASGALKQAGTTFYAWPGCLLGRDYGEAGQKGSYLVHVSHGHAELCFLPSVGPRWQLIRASAGEDVRRTIEEITTGQEAGDHLRLTLTGICPRFDAQKLAEGCRGSLAELEIIDETEDSDALWQAAGENSLRGAFLNQLLDMANGDNAQARELARLAAQYGLAALEGREEP